MAVLPKEYYILNEFAANYTVEVLSSEEFTDEDKTKFKNEIKKVVLELRDKNKKKN